MNEFDDISVNPSTRQSLTELSSPLRRRVLISSAIAGLFAVRPAWSEAAALAPAPKTLFQFTSVPISQAADNVIVPAGYQWSVVAAWGDPIDGVGKAMQADASDSFADQEKQFGMHHDGGAFFAEQGASHKGLWVVNHEYTDDGLLHVGGMANWSAEKVKKSQAAHGVTIAMVERQTNGAWKPVPSPLSRRITAYTPCRISGPAAGHPLLKTAADPEGKLVLGTLNNCAHGVTPWGTYLTCEENINGYFVKEGAVTREEARIGLETKGFGYRWHEFDERFNANKHPNELNRFGWVVEIDPRNPLATPVKRTALGRFKHEGAVVTVAKNGHVVVYMGDDQRHEYVYKFVSSGKFDVRNPTAAQHRQLLDDGKLYVARFDANGQGQWLLLAHGKNGLTTENGFPDQGYINIHARLAADFVGATPMDRPEWIAVHPVHQEVYVTLTNNADRGVKSTLNAANPRAKNSMGHIVRWQEHQRDVTSTSFTWEIFVLAGDPTLTDANLVGTIRGDTFGSPDGLWFDRRGILWTQTDISTSTLGKNAYQNMPNNCMYAADPKTREFRRFLIGPKGCEITGVALTPDLKTMFVNIQHPGETPSERSDPANPTAISSWPDAQLSAGSQGAQGKMRPRSATIAIWRTDGAMVGT